MDIDCERRPSGTRNEHKRSGGQQQEQTDLEKSCWGLIIGDRLTEEKLRILMFFALIKQYVIGLGGNKNYIDYWLKIFNN